MSYFLRGLPFGVTFETTFTLDMLNEMIEITASLPNLLTGSRWTGALPESMVNMGSHRTTNATAAAPVRGLALGWNGAF